MKNLPKVVKKFDVDFFNNGALTLDPEFIGVNKSKWAITGKIRDDYYQWVNYFYAVHPKLGRVWGDFEREVYADSEEGLAHFLKNHPPKNWCYDDI